MPLRVSENSGVGTCKARSDVTTSTNPWWRLETTIVDIQRVQRGWIERTLVDGPKKTRVSPERTSFTTPV